MLPRMGIVLVFFVASSHVCLAKPADLPGDIFQQCPQARDGQQIEGFPQRPDAVEAPRSAPVGTRELTRRAVRDAGNFEEQDSPPARFNYREPSERRDISTTPGWRMRDPHRQSSEDERRQEMLRSTQPLDTLRERPIGEVEQEAADEEAELPPVALPEQHTNAAQSECTDAIDELSWLPPSTRANLRAYFAWRNSRHRESDNLREQMIQITRSIETAIQYRQDTSVEIPWAGWTARSLCGVQLLAWTQPCTVSQHIRETVEIGWVEIPSGSLALAPPKFVSKVHNTCEFKATSIGHAQIPSLVGITQVRDPDEPGLFNVRLLDSYDGAAIGVSLPDCFNRGSLLMRGQPILILVYPPLAIRGFIDEDGSVSPCRPIGDFPAPRVLTPFDIGISHVN